MILKCLVCGKEFNTTITRTKKYCNKICYFSTRRGKNNPQWKGGRRITRWGYCKVTTPYGHPRRKSKGNGYMIFEHRLVMEKHIGRYLLPTEFVHHIDGNKLNNKVKNLVIITKGKHNTIHFKGKPSKRKGRKFPKH